MSGPVAYGTAISLSTTTDGAEILYTIDGSTPSVNSLVYGSPIIIDNAITIKAIAVKAGAITSDVMTASYTLLGPPQLTVTGLSYQSLNILRATFNMPVDEVTAETVGNYLFSSMINMMSPPINPDSATLLQSGTEVDLDVGSWYDGLPAGDIITLSISNVEDTNGAVIEFGYNNAPQLEKE